MNSRVFNGRFGTGIALAVVVGTCLLGVAACAQHGGQASTPPGQAAGASQPAAPPLPSTAPQLQNDYEAVVARVLPSVVQITTDQGLGSGGVGPSPIPRPRPAPAMVAWSEGKEKSFWTSIDGSHRPSPAELGLLSDLSSRVTASG